MSANNFSFQLPSHIEPSKWAEQGFNWTGLVPLSRFARIAREAYQSIDEPSANELGVQVDCRLSKDEYQPRVIWVDANLAVTVPMVCQRCLEPVDVAVATQVHLALVTDAAHAANLPEDADFVVLDEEQIVHGTDDVHTIDLIELLEDELLVSMPISPRHESCENRHQPLVEDEPELIVRENPFDVLASLKGKLDS